MKIILNNTEEKLLLEPNKGSDWFQSLFNKLRSNFTSQIMQLVLDDDVLEKIPRYAFKYKQGGWQKKLISIFGRHLGQQLDKP